jgi:hypothetical protein
LSAEAAYRRVVTRIRNQPDVEEGRAFHAPGLKVHGRIFAMLVDDHLVVKLPPERCSQLVHSGAARPFSSGQRKMKEWVSVRYSNTRTWTTLADEALRFVRG